MSLRQSLARVPGARWVYRTITRQRDLPAGAYDDRPANDEVRADLALLARRNRRSRDRVVDATSRSVVSVTTHGKRIKSVHTALESIARGTALPARLILWLDDPTIAARLPRAIRRLQARGLEVITVPRGMRVHTKYYFYVQSSEHHAADLVTADDDIVYPPEWLAGLEAAAAGHPGSIIAYRSHSMVVADEGITPYRSWPPTSSTEPSFRNFGTSVSGQLWPASFLDFVREQGDAFRAITPDNDDVWLHALAVRSGVRVAQVAAHSQHFPFVPGTQAVGLYLTNTVEGANDRQIAATYSPQDIERLIQEP